EEKEFAILGMLPGVLASILIFFQLHVNHDYYQLPFLLVAPLLAAYFVEQLLARCSEFRVSTPQGVLSAGLCALVCALSWYSLRIPLTPPSRLMEAGEFIRGATAADAFIVYPHRDSIYFPPGLYFAKRRGESVRYAE